MVAQMHLTTAAAQILRQNTGIVIPVYLQPGHSAPQEEQLLEDTVTAYVREIGTPERVCLAVDGEEFGAAVAAKIASRMQLRLAVSEHNRGKLNAARLGVQTLWNTASLDYFAVVDQDGDHFANELLNFVRAALHAVADEDAEPNVLVLGRRLSRHRPMGFLRGELEELADRILLNALEYHAVLSGRPLSLQFATLFDEFPDFHSGYKLFSRTAAKAAFLQKPVLSGVSGDCYYRHACEAVMTVEALVQGARLLVVNRTTFNEQPVSTFARLQRQQLVADKIIWPCRRLKIPGVFVDQWLQNHLPRLLLPTLTPEGQQELEQIRRLVVQEVVSAPNRQQEILAKPLQRPLFL